MAQPLFDDYLDAPLKLLDYIEIIGGDIDEAVGVLNEREVEQLVTAIRRKLKDIAGDGEPVEPQWWQRD